MVSSEQEYLSGKSAGEEQVLYHYYIYYVYVCGWVGVCYIVSESFHYYEILNVVPCAIQWDLVVYLFYM